MKNIYYTIILVSAGVIPVKASAQILQSSGGFRGAVGEITRIITTALLPMLFAAALAYFIWGVANFIRAADSPDERKKGKQQILWGIIALFVMFGYFAITSVFTNSVFGFSISLPQLFSNQ